MLDPRRALAPLALAAVASLGLASPSSAAPSVTVTGPLTQAYVGPGSKTMSVHATDPHGISRMSWTSDDGQSQVMSVGCPEGACDATTKTLGPYDANRPTEGNHTITLEVRCAHVGTGGTHATTQTLAFAIDRSAPSVPSGFQQGLFYPDDPDHAVTISWAESTDPGLPGGAPGSGVAGYQARYSLNGGAFTAWAATEGPALDLAGVAVGSTVRVEVTANDAVGNTSAAGTATIAIAAQNEDPSVDDMAAQAYASDYGTTIAVAQAWMAVQGRADSLGEQVSASSSGGGYGGTWFDNVSRKVVVNLKSGTPSDGAQAVLAGDGLANDSRIAVVSHTEPELDQGYDVVEAQLADLVAAQLIDLSRDDEANAVDIEVGTDATAQQRSRIAQVAAGAPVHVTVTDSTYPNFQTEDLACTERPDPAGVLPGKVPLCDFPLRGGVYVLGSAADGSVEHGCGSAFTASIPDRSAYFLMTAGHCLDGFPGDSSTWLSFTSDGTGERIGPNAPFVHDDRGDAGIIRVAADSDWRVFGGPPRPWIFVRPSGTGTARRDTHYRIRSVFYSHKGDYVCMSGAATAGHCGTILKVRDGAQDFGVIKICRADHGDSGSPVVRRGSARGIVVQKTENFLGQDRCEVRFQSAKIAESLLDVSILTR